MRHRCVLLLWLGSSRDRALLLLLLRGRCLHLMLRQCKRLSGGSVRRCGGGRTGDLLLLQLHLLGMRHRHWHSWCALRRDHVRIIRVQVLSVHRKLLGAQHLSIHSRRHHHRIRISLDGNWYGSPGTGTRLRGNWDRACCGTWRSGCALTST